MSHSSQSRRLSLWHTFSMILVLVALTSGFWTAFRVDTTPVYAQKNVSVETIRFSPNAQISNQPLQLSLTRWVPGTIHYTTDGSWPTADSPTFNGPLVISKSTALRAQMFDENGNPVGEVYTKSYIIADYQQTIPAISIVTDRGHLYWLDDYPEEHYQNLERPITMEYFAPGGQIQFNVKATIRIHGSKARLYSPKKSYLISFQPGSLEYPLFENTPVLTFDHLVLRAAFNDSLAYADVSGVEPHIYAAKYIGDQVVRNLHQDLGQPVVHTQWVLVYLNGEYQGLYNLMEHIDRQFFRSYSDPESEWDVIEKKAGRTVDSQWVIGELAVAGNYDAWLATQTWVGHTDFTNPANITELESRVDLENLLSYVFLQAYVQNYDWPDNYWIAYRRSDQGASSDEAKWRMMVWDAEFSFGNGRGGLKTNVDTLSQLYTSPDSTIRLLAEPFSANCKLTDRFVQRAREYLGVESLQDKSKAEGGQLSKERVTAEILKQAAMVRPFVRQEAERWAPAMNLTSFDQSIQNALTFVEEREEMMLQYLDILKYQAFNNCN